jgi:3',5'-cyclic-AMP phosphodiesterase
MSRPFLLAQLSDPHIGADWGAGDPVSAFAAAVGAILALPQPPDAVLVSGDLAEHAADAEYEQVRELLAPLEAPVYVLAGNHDERGALRRHFELPAAGGDSVQYSADLGPLRLVVLDTTCPGEDSGAIDAERIDWLDTELAAAPDTPTVLAMHHPPLVTGLPAWDELLLPAADRQALSNVIGRHPQVRRLVAGHVHRAMTADLAGRVVQTVPSTYLQARLNFDSERIELVEEAAGFALHALLDGEVTTHLQSVLQHS